MAIQNALGNTDNVWAFQSLYIIPIANKYRILNRLLAFISFICITVKLVIDSHRYLIGKIIIIALCINEYDCDIVRSKFQPQCGMYIDQRESYFSLA